jgi:flagellar hook-length control protein FliK
LLICGLTNLRSRRSQLKAVNMEGQPASLWELIGKKSDQNAKAGLFQALFAQLSQDQQHSLVAAPRPERAAQPEPPAAGRTSGREPSGGPVASPFSPPEPPIQQLKQGLEETGRPLESFTVPAEQREDLRRLLEHSGYSREDAQEIIARASEDDGSVNLGAMFQVLPQYIPDAGPVFALEAKDKGLLVQALQELGLPQKKVQDFVEALPRQGDKIIVSGLPRLLAEAESASGPRSEQPQVDTTYLRQLLAKLGVSDQDAEALLATSRDGQGRMSPEAALRVLEAAARTQSQSAQGALQEVAKSLQLADGAASEADRLRQQVMQALQRSELQQQEQARLAAQAQAQARGENPGEAKPGLGEALRAAAQEAGAEPKDPKGDLAAAARLGREEGKAQAARDAAAGGKGGEQDASRQHAGQNPDPRQAMAAAARAGGGGRGQAAATQAGGQGQAQGQAPGAEAGSSPAAGPAAGASGAAAAKAAAGPRPFLPAYVARQVGDQLALMAKNGQSQLRLNLKPPELGGVHLRLSVDHGMVKATLTADNAAAKTALEAGLNDLRQQLAQQGLKLERMEVLVNDGQNQDRAAPDGRPGSGGGRGRGGELAAGESGGEAEGPEMTHALSGPGGGGRVNLFA